MSDFGSGSDIGELAAVKELDLDHAGHGHVLDGEKAVAAAIVVLKMNATLQTLNLMFNQVGDAGATSLASALKRQGELHEAADARP